MKILLYSDSPLCNTGFATVTKNLVRILKDHEVTVYGINHHGIYPKNDYDIIPAVTVGEFMQGAQDVYGLQRLVDSVKGFDVLITVNDHFILQLCGKALRQACDKHNVKWIGYFPIDSEIRKEWADTMALCDVPVFYTEYGANQFMKFSDKPFKIIYHGTDVETFYPIGQTEKDQARMVFFSHAKGKKLIVNVNRNQPRKYIPETMMQFKRLLEQRDDVHLYLHMKRKDFGYDLSQLADWVGLPTGSWSHAAGDIPVNLLNAVYNVADVFFTTHLGEGWGLTVTEAMATKTPVVVPDNTSMTEIVMGYKVKQDSWVCLGTPDFDRIRPAGGDYVPALNQALDNPNEEYVQGNYDFVNKYTWDHVGEKWNALLSATK